MLDLKISDITTGEVLRVIPNVDISLAKSLANDYGVMGCVSVEVINNQTQEVIFTTD